MFSLNKVIKTSDGFYIYYKIIIVYDSLSVVTNTRLMNRSYIIAMQINKTNIRIEYL